MNYIDWIALGVWFILMGVLMFLWGIDELISLSPSAWTDGVMSFGLAAVLIGSAITFHGIEVFGSSCDARPCLVEPGILKES